MAPYSLFCEGLEKAGLKQERRALRLLVNDLEWTWLDESAQEAGRETNHEKRTPDLRLTFTLPAGAYATALLREIVSTGQ